MNLKGKYDMLRQATLQMVGCPTDDVEELKALASVLRVPAISDPDAAVSLLVLQTLIATHVEGGAEYPDLWVRRFQDWCGDERLTDDDVRKMFRRVLSGES